MKIWKLVSGIISTVLVLVVIVQSCAAGAVNAMEKNKEVSGSAGIFVAILLLAAGIVSIVVRNSTKKGGNIALIILFGLAALIGFVGAGNYSDLYIWSVWCLICAILAVVSIVLNNKNSKTINEENKSE